MFLRIMSIEDITLLSTLILVVERELYGDILGHRHRHTSRIIEEIYNYWAVDPFDDISDAALEVLTYDVEGALEEAISALNQMFGQRVHRLRVDIPAQVVGLYFEDVKCIPVSIT